MQAQLTHTQAVNWVKQSVGKKYDFDGLTYKSM